MRCCTINVEGLTGNLPFILECARVNDILFIQEHWLFNCQKDTLTISLKDWYNTVACTDDLNPIAQHCMPRGWGGVAILWRKNVGHLIKPIKVESQRITAVKVSQGNERSLMLANVYLPSGNAAAKKVEYLTTLAQLSTLSETHADCDILLAGDFNIDIFKISYEHDQRRKELLSMAEDLGLKQLVPPTRPTMLAHNGRDASIIDLVFSSNPNRCSAPTVGEKVPWNTSCHNPVYFSLICRGLQRSHKRRKTQRALVIQKDTVDKLRFDRIIDSYLTLFQTHLIHPHDAAQVIVCLLKAATLQASDVRMSSLTPSRKITYPEDVIQALKKSRRIHAEWKEVGRPEIPHPTATARHKASRTVRSALRTSNAQKRESKYRGIMDAAFGDQRLFHSLVQDHKAKVQAADTMFIDGKLSSDPDALREGWATYYEKLATPGDNPDWSAAALRDAEEIVSSKSDRCVATPRTVVFETEDVSTAIQRLNKGKAADLDGIRAEHLKDPSEKLIDALTCIFDGMLDVGASTELKLGKKIPIPKKAKDPKEMQNRVGKYDP